MKNFNRESAVCQICKKEKKIQLMRPVDSVRPAILQLMNKDGIEPDPRGYICIDDLNKYRKLYLQNIMEEEKGVLNENDKEVLDSIVERDLISRNVEQDIDKKITFGQRLSDNIARFGGSWKFISLFMSFLVIWMIINVIFLTTQAFDPYPFILLNLILSCIAAIQAPVIMMSQNRQEEKDRMRSLHDYQVNLKAEVEIRLLHDKIDHMIVQHGQRMMEIQQIQIELMEEISNKMKK
ncbi:MAG: DUF1003 domain-containing protein [Ignavibacteriaceae bacterium]